MTGHPDAGLFLLLYGNTWEAKVNGVSLGWFSSAEEARAAIRSAEAALRLAFGEPPEGERPRSTLE